MRHHWDLPKTFTLTVRKGLWCTHWTPGVSEFCGSEGVSFCVVFTRWKSTVLAPGHIHWGFEFLCTSFHQVKKHPGAHARAGHIHISDIRHPSFPSIVASRNKYLHTDDSKLTESRQQTESSYTAQAHSWFTHTDTLNHTQACDETLTDSSQLLENRESTSVSTTHITGLYLLILFMLWPYSPILTQ